MEAIRQILNDKGSEIFTTTPDTSVYEALKIMSDKNVGALVVLDEGGMAGMVSERDYARKVILEERASKTTPVREIMTANVITIHPDETIDSCMELMSEKHIRHLVVAQDDKPIGVVSVVDIIKAIIDSQQFKIQRLEDYIMSG